ncbi:MAG: hypothetical protein H6766_00155 [Candidatus Peribacteria bacterium]|nr:MAG: hypothetical protein H6766_00155 [Candidatus Peribacteria bacterium]
MYLVTPTQQVAQELTPDMIEVTQPTVTAEVDTDTSLLDDSLAPMTGTVTE